MPSPEPRAPPGIGGGFLPRSYARRATRNGGAGPLPSGGPAAAAGHGGRRARLQRVPRAPPLRRPAHGASGSVPDHRYGEHAITVGNAVTPTERTGLRMAVGVDERCTRDEPCREKRLIRGSGQRALGDLRAPAAPGRPAGRPGRGPAVRRPRGPWAAGRLSTSSTLPGPALGAADGGRRACRRWRGRSARSSRSAVAHGGSTTSSRISQPTTDRPGHHHPRAAQGMKRARARAGRRHAAVVGHRSPGPQGRFGQGQVGGRWQTRCRGPAGWQASESRRSGQTCARRVSPPACVERATPKAYSPPASVPGMPRGASGSDRSCSAHRRPRWLVSSPSSWAWCSRSSAGRAAGSCRGGIRCRGGSRGRRGGCAIGALGRRPAGSRPRRNAAGDRAVKSCPTDVDAQRHYADVLWKPRREGAGRGARSPRRIIELSPGRCRAVRRWRADVSSISASFDDADDGSPARRGRVGRQPAADAWHLHGRVALGRTASRIMPWPTSHRWPSLPMIARVARHGGGLPAARQAAARHWPRWPCSARPTAPMNCRPACSPLEGMAQEALGRTDDARESYRQAIAKGETSPEINARMAAAVIDHEVGQAYRPDLCREPAGLTYSRRLSGCRRSAGRTADRGHEHRGGGEAVGEGRHEQGLQRLALQEARDADERQRAAGSRPPSRWRAIDRGRRGRHDEPHRASHDDGRKRRQLQLEARAKGHHDPHRGGHAHEEKGHRAQRHRDRLPRGRIRGAPRRSEHRRRRRGGSPCRAQGEPMLGGGHSVATARRARSAGRRSPAPPPTRRAACRRIQPAPDPSRATHPGCPRSRSVVMLVTASAVTASRLASAPSGSRPPRPRRSGRAAAGLGLRQVPATAAAKSTSHASRTSADPPAVGPGAGLAPRRGLPTPCAGRGRSARGGRPAATRRPRSTPASRPRPRHC